MKEIDFKVKTVLDLLFETSAICDSLLDEEYPIADTMRDEIATAGDKIFSIYQEYAINNF